LENTGCSIEWHAKKWREYHIATAIFLIGRVPQNIAGFKPANREERSSGFGVGVRGKIGLVTIAHEGQSPDAITAWRNALGTKVELPASANGARHW